MAMFLLLCLLYTPTSFAANRMTVSPLIYKHLQKVDEQINQNRFDEAQKHCTDLLNKKSLNPYEKSIIQQMLAGIYIREENYQQATQSYQRVLSLAALPKANLLNIHYSLAQLFMQQGVYDKALEHFNLWLRENPQAKAEEWQFLASIYVAKEQYLEAVKPAEKALALTASTLTTSSREPLYQLLLGLYQRTNNNQQAILLLKKMIEIFPKTKEYWMQLFYMLNEEGKDKLALATLDLAYVNKLLDEGDELSHLAQLHIFHNNPLRAALILESGIKRGSIKATHSQLQLLASAWFNAKEYEKSLTALEQAAKLSGDGKIYFQLAQAYSELSRWQEVVVALQKALDDKSLKNIGASYLLMGIAYIELENYSQAQASFENSLLEDKTKKEANTWLAYLTQRMAEQDYEK
jgi:tetratricopeptide (TPR) repeat protein